MKEDLFTLCRPHYELGMAYIILGRLANRNATQSYRKALLITPNYVDAKRMLQPLINNQDST